MRRVNPRTSCVGVNKSRQVRNLALRLPDRRTPLSLKFIDRDGAKGVQILSFDYFVVRPVVRARMQWKGSDRLQLTLGNVLRLRHG